MKTWKLNGCVQKTHLQKLRKTPPEKPPPPPEYIFLLGGTGSFHHFFCWHQNHGISQKIGKKTGKTRARNPQPHNQGISELVQPDPPPASRTKRIPHLVPVEGGDGSTTPSKTLSWLLLLVIFPYNQFSKLWLFWL